MINNKESTLGFKGDTTSKFKKIVIVIFPFLTFVGPYIGLSSINLSNIYSLLLFFLFIKSLMKKEFKYIKGYIAFFSLMLIYALISLIWSEDSHIGLTIIFPLITGFLAMTFIASLNGIELNLFLKSLTMFSMVLLIWSLFEIFTGKYILFSNVDFIYSKNYLGFHYPGVAFSNPNDLAQFLLVAWPLLILVKFENKRQLISSILIFFVTIFILVNTESRLSVVSSFILIFSYLLFSKRKIRGFMIVFFLICVGGTLQLFGLELKNLKIFQNFLQVNTSASYYTIRSNIYHNVIELGLNHFLFGAGLGSSYTVNSGFPPHNMELFIFGDLGVFFALGFIVILLIAFLYLFKNKGIQVCGLQLNIIVLSVFVTFPLIQIISSGNEQRKAIWLFLGLVFVLINNIKKQKVLKS